MNGRARLRPSRLFHPLRRFRRKRPLVERLAPIASPPRRAVTSIRKLPLVYKWRSRRFPPYNASIPKIAAPIQPIENPKSKIAMSLTHIRLRNQRIAHPFGSDEIARVVSHLGAMQAQDYNGSLWGIGLRASGATETDVERAVADRKIVRTWPMRGTLHFVAAEDVRWMLRLLTPRVIAGSARRHQELELDVSTLARCEKVLTAELEGGRHLTREVLSAALERNGIPMSRERNYHVFWRLAQEQVICFGARSGKQQTFTLLDEWIPSGRSFDGEAALAEIAVRYFRSHGPATLQDFAWWSGLRAADARSAVDLAARELASETIEGRAHWFAADTASPPESPRAHFLPGFDEFLLGYTDRSATLPVEHAPKIVPGSNGVFLPTVVIDGQTVGIWKRALRKKSGVLKITPFTKLRKADDRALAEAAERYARYLDLPLSIES